MRVMQRTLGLITSLNLHLDQITAQTFTQDALKLCLTKHNPQVILSANVRGREIVLSMSLGDYVLHGKTELPLCGFGRAINSDIICSFTYDS
jgi:hypothetical protein